ncbi:MAG: response regulator [Myxococcales bacterium]|nr:response regulator [Myxococcales bacterium]
MSMTVLVVDNSRDVRMSLTEVLNPLGFEAVVAASSDEALERVDEGIVVDLVITDYSLPGMNGVELTRVLRSNLAYERVPILVLSTEAHRDFHLEVQAVGATGWLVKPVKLEQLLQAVNQVRSLSLA